MKRFRSSGKTKDYEKEYLTRYNEQEEPKQNKNTSKDKKSIKKNQKHYLQNLNLPNKNTALQ